MMMKLHGTMFPIFFCNTLILILFCTQKNTYTLSFFIKTPISIFTRHFRLDMCRRQYANDQCNRGTAGNEMYKEDPFSDPCCEFFSCLLTKQSFMCNFFFLYLYKTTLFPFFSLYLWDFFEEIMSKVNHFSPFNNTDYILYL